MSAIEKLVTDNIDVWTSAIEQRSTQGRGSSSKIKLYGIQKLRELILELAVRGLLVPQDPNDEPASVLLKKIEAEKSKLVKEGKARKQKPLQPIREDKKPFALPGGWEWAYLGELSSDIHYGYTASAQPENEGTRLLRITDIQDDKVNWGTVPGCEITDKKAEGYLLEDNDILIARTGGTIGKSYLVENINVKAVFASYLIRVKRISAMYSPYIKTYLGSAIYWTQLYDNASGTGQPNVNATALKQLLVPIPTVEAQHRIVAKVDELMALCDQLEQQQTDSITAHQTLVETLLNGLVESAKSTNSNNKNTSEYFNQLIANHFDTLFTTEHSIDQLSRKIIFLASTGNVLADAGTQELNTTKVNQKVNILEIAKEEKKELLKKGEIKVEKINPISIDTPYNSIPKDWVLCQLNDVTCCLDHRRIPIKKSERAEGDIPYYGANGPVGHIGGYLLVSLKVKTTAFRRSDLSAILTPD